MSPYASAQRVASAAGLSSSPARRLNSDHTRLRLHSVRAISSSNAAACAVSIVVRAGPPSFVRD